MFVSAQKSDMLALDNNNSVKQDGARRPVMGWNLALKATKHMLTERQVAAASTHFRCERPLRRFLQLHPHLILNPVIGSAQSVFQRNFRLPSQYLPQERVIGIAAAHTHGAGDMLEFDLNSSDLGNHECKLVDRDHAVLAEV